MLITLIALPLLMAIGAYALRDERLRPWLLPATAAPHLVLVICALARGTQPTLAGWLRLDAIGGLVLLLVSVLFAATACYCVAYLRHETQKSNRVFCVSMLGFLSMMTLLTLSHHLGLMWVAMEATTLASAPLICFHRSPLSLEATWKYLLICSVGIALALLGSFFLAYASLYQGLPSSLLFEQLLVLAPRLSVPWLQAAFVLLLVGYGTKMGLAPMHTWLPDAHGEAPAPVSAMLSGALLPCAFIPILRVYQICAAAGHADFARRLLVIMGLLSMTITAIFVIRQRDLKRMLAYSSVEHMGILALGVGLGGAGLFGAMLHILTNGLTKGMLFLSAGNILQAYGSKSTEDVSGVMKRLPLTGPMFLVGFLAITGSPPFGPFVSEFTILSAAFHGGRYVAAGLTLVLLLIVFMGMGSTVLAAIHGRPSELAARSHFREGLLTTLPLVALGICVLLLGVYLPAPLRHLLQGAVQILEPRP
jgi:hydrogenase-4 component F